jgi:transposase-like protein
MCEFFNNLLERMRWPGGFKCPNCGVQGEPFRFPGKRHVVLRCKKCLTNTYLTAGTVMQKTHTPLSTWFWGAYLATTQTPGQSALQFQRQLGLKRYETAFQILHKLRAGMIRPERDPIGGDHPVEVDECFIGGRSQAEDGQHHQTVVIGAVEVRLRKDAEERKAKHKQEHEGGIPLKKLIYAGRLRLMAVEGRGQADVIPFILNTIKEGATVRTDGLSSYENLKELGYNHKPLTIDGDFKKADAHLPMIHIVFSNLKTWLLGTHHGAVAQHHLQAYLNEYVYRFNRRFYPMTAFNNVLGIAAQSKAPTYAQLYSGDWRHPK